MPFSSNYKECSVFFLPSKHLRLITLATQTDNAPVLILGTAGTGKGTMARWIHQNSSNSNNIFLKAAHNKPIAQSIIEADGGSLFISEIGQYPLAQQKTLLQYLETRKIKDPINTNNLLSPNVRIISSSSQILEGRAQAGFFNPKLLEKLNVFRLEMPKLKDRKDEFENIANNILKEVARDLKKENITNLSRDAIRKLLNYEWPGNIRELRNVLRLAATNSNGDSINASDLPNFGLHRADFCTTREGFERVYLLELFELYNGKIEPMCEQTGLDRNILTGKLKKYGIKI